MNMSTNWRKSELQHESTADEAEQATEEMSSSDTWTVRTLALDEDAMRGLEEDTGVDPYNTGRFDSGKP